MREIKLNEKIYVLKEDIKDDYILRSDLDRIFSEKNMDDAYDQGFKDGKYEAFFNSLTELL